MAVAKVFHPKLSVWRQTKAVEYVKLNGRITNKEYQKINNISRETATIDLRSLVKLGILKSSGTRGAGAFYELS